MRTSDFIANCGRSNLSLKDDEKFDISRSGNSLRLNFSPSSVLKSKFMLPKPSPDSPKSFRTITVSKGKLEKWALPVALKNLSNARCTFPSATLPIE